MSSEGTVVSNYIFSQARLLLHCSTLGYEPKSNVLVHLIYFLFTIYNQFLKHAKGELDVIFVSMIMFLFVILTIRMILYEQMSRLD